MVVSPASLADLLARVLVTAVQGAAGVQRLLPAPQPGLRPAPVPARVAAVRPSHPAAPLPPGTARGPLSGAARR